MGISCVLIDTTEAVELFRTAQDRGPVTVHCCVAVDCWGINLGRERNVVRMLKYARYVFIFKARKVNP